MRAKPLLTGTIALLLGGFVSLHAQDPSARVARASYLQGEVSFRPATVDDWTSATLNYPLTTGDHLWTDTASRAELQVGSNAIRLAPLTAFEILSLDDNHVQLRLTQGAVLVSLNDLEDDDNIEIDTPTGAVSLLRTGTYRVDVSEDGATSTVTVRQGNAEVASNSSTVPVRADETVLFTADGASPDVRAAAPLDEYDEWAMARDRSIDQSVSAQYVGRDMTGYEDLDANGTWDNDPQYGHVWIPAHVASGWAPYRYGRWAWVEPWGWTWIDDAPWGFAPFHYGRWAYVRNRWVWAPGVIVRRPVYAPALVAFVGGSHFSVSVGFGSGGGVAWFPLAPGEVYRPAYHASDRYVRNVNVTNVHVTNINVTNVNVTNVRYRNQRVAGAVTAVRNDEFAGSRSIGRRGVVVPVNEASSAHVVGNGAPVTPTRQSILVRRTSSTVVRPPETVIARHVVSKNTPRTQPATFHPASQPAPRSTARPVTTVRPNVDVQPYPRTQPATTDRPRTTERPAASEPNTTVRPNVNVHAQPAARPQPSERRTAPRTEVDQPSATRAAPPPKSHPTETKARTSRAPEVRPNADARRSPPEEKTKPQHDNKSPRHG